MGTALQAGRLHGLASLLVCPMDQHWTPKPNVTLIGDAAHLMPPCAGEGVNMAMLDALALSKSLLSEEAPGVAIAAYEAEMFSRMRSMTAETMANTEMFYAPDACERVVALFVASVEERRFRQPARFNARSS